MCGRFMLKTPIGEIADLFGLDSAPVLPPRYNIAPSQDAAIIRRTESGTRELALAQFGLVPPWAEDPKTGYKMINARGETVDRLPSFREAYRKRRCLVPTDGFYEWQALDPSGKGPKQPFVIRRPDEKPFAFAGIHERWRSKDGARVIESFAIVTTSANQRLRPVHPRMPVVLDAGAWERWLDPATDGRPLLRPCPEDWLSAVMIGPRINRPAHDDPSVLAPMDRPLAPSQGSLF
ncbi:MAG: SOS response-associated peptidase [Alphaproteobacteria bacterium]